MDRFSDYDPFAWLYATRWGAEYHDQAWHILDKLLFHQLSPGASVLDLCCGDGRLTSVLHAKGFRVRGIDGSEEMLGFARERCPDVAFAAGDARTFETECRFDAVISTFDALNHLMSADELAMVCRRVEQALNPGGYFAFDINREEAYTELWPQTYAQIEPQVVQICVGSYKPDARVATSAITLFRLVDGAQAAPPREQLTRHVKEQLARVLGMAVGDVPDWQRGFTDLGLDSLLAMELRNRLQASLACRLPATLTFKYPRLEPLVAYLAAEVLHLDEPAPSAAADVR